MGGGSGRLRRWDFIRVVWIKESGFWVGQTLFLLFGAARGCRSPHRFLRTDNLTGAEKDTAQRSDAPHVSCGRSSQRDALPPAGSGTRGWRRYRGGGGRGPAGGRSDDGVSSARAGFGNRGGDAAFVPVCVGGTGAEMRLSGTVRAAAVRGHDFHSEISGYASSPALAIAGG